MTTQAWGLLMHIGFSFLFVTYLKFGIMGTALATFFSNLFIFVVNEMKTKAQEDLIELTSVRITDPNVNRDFYEYLKIGIPNMLTLFMEFASYEIMILLVGYLGVVQ